MKTGEGNSGFCLALKSQKPVLTLGTGLTTIKCHVQIAYCY